MGDYNTLFRTRQREVVRMEASNAGLRSTSGGSIMSLAEDTAGLAHAIRERLADRLDKYLVPATPAAPDKLKEVLIKVTERAPYFSMVDEHLDNIRQSLFSIERILDRFDG